MLRATRRWLASGPAEQSEPAAQHHEQALLAMLVPRAQAQIDAQLGNSDSLDAKALGVLGVAVAAIGVLVATRDDLSACWWIPPVALAIAGVMLLGAIWPRKFDAGPDTRRFYESMANATPLVASRQMLSELLAAIPVNDRALVGKVRLFRWGSMVVLLGLGGTVWVAL